MRNLSKVLQSNLCEPLTKYFASIFANSTQITRHLQDQFHSFLPSTLALGPKLTCSKKLTHFCDMDRVIVALSQVTS